MLNLGTFQTGAILSFMFTTVNASGVPTALASGGIAVYKGADVAETTAGTGLAASFDSRTGLNVVVIDTSADAAFYTNNAHFDVVLTAGTVDGVSIAGYVVGHFSLGYGVNVSKVNGSAINNLVSGRIDAHIGSVADAVLTAAKFASGAFDAVWSVAARTLTAFGFSVTVGTNNDKDGYRLSATGVDDILDEAVNEPAGVFTWPSSLRGISGWLGALARNKTTVTQSTGTQALRNDADSADIASAAISDDGDTFTKGEWS